MDLDFGRGMGGVSAGRRLKQPEIHTAGLAYHRSGEIHIFWGWDAWVGGVFSGRRLPLFERDAVSGR